MLRILLLGAISGFPWVLIGSALTLWLNEDGISRSTIGWAGLIFGVYAINFLWAPLIDRIKIHILTSIVGHTGNVGQANYTASKAGIVAMSKSLALEYAKKNINVNCISPGFISTAMTDQIDEKFKEAIIAKIPANRLGTLEDVANVVAFLSSKESDYINGETIHVNGGMYLG